MQSCLRFVRQTNESSRTGQAPAEMSWATMSAGLWGNHSNHSKPVGVERRGIAKVNMQLPDALVRPLVLKYRTNSQQSFSCKNLELSCAICQKKIRMQTWGCSQEPFPETSRMLLTLLQALLALRQGQNLQQHCSRGSTLHVIRSSWKARASSNACSSVSRAAWFQAEAPMSHVQSPSQDTVT